MNNEYWNMVLLGKPRLLFYVTVILFITTGAWLCFDWKSGENCAGLALIFTVLGWFNSMESGFYSSDVLKSRRSWFGWMAWLLFIAIMPGCIRKHSHPDEGYSLSRHLWETGKEMFAKEPPLNIRNERRPEMLGLEKVDFLIITNKSGEGVVPITGTLHGAKHTFPISLPPVLKPYETIEVRLQNQKTKWIIEKGDLLTIECEGYGKPLTMKW